MNTEISNSESVPVHRRFPNSILRSRTRGASGLPAESGRRKWAVNCTAVALALLSSDVLAQDAAVDWYRASNGGGVSTGNSCTIMGTIGQAEPGAMSGNVVIQAGFWSVVAVATPPASIITWTNLARNRPWSVAANWSPNQVPGPSDNVNITQLGSDVIVDAHVTIGSLTLANQSFIDPGPGKLTITGPLNWLSGTIRGTVQCNGGMLGDGGTLYGSHKYLDGGKLINVGALTNNTPMGFMFYTGDGSVISNLAGATFDWTTDTHNALMSGPGTFYNAGLFRKSGGMGGTTYIQDIFKNTGTVEIRGGVLRFTQPYAQSDGVTRLLEGSLWTEQRFKLDGGTLAGTNTLIGNVTSSGTVSPGDALGSPGLLTINGNYAQTDSGALQIELGGSVPGTGFDKLAVTGTASLAGTLEVSLVNGFVPPANSTFTILTASSRTGTFSAINYPAILAGSTVVYDDHSATLRIAHPVAKPALLSLHFTGAHWVRGVDSFTLSWPSSLTNVRLEESTDLTASIWSPMSLTPESDETTMTVMLPVSAMGVKFYRLVPTAP